jgi:diguanylate cyclase (GGDEF)-like protein
VRDTDAIGRFGGDEFLVVATAVPSFDYPQFLGERIRDALALCFTPETSDAAIASIGVAFAPTTTTITAHDLISLADPAMCRSKADGRGEPVIDRTALNEAA